MSLLIWQKLQPLENIITRTSYTDLLTPCLPECLHITDVPFSIYRESSTEHRAEGEEQDSTIIVYFPGTTWLSSVFLFVSSSSIDPSSSSITVSARCVQIWTLYSAGMWVSVFAWIKEELTLREQQQPVTRSLLCQKQNSTDKENRNSLCPIRSWVPSLWKAELSLKWQNLPLIFIFQRPSAITLHSVVTSEDCAGTYTQRSAGCWEFPSAP